MYFHLSMVSIIFSHTNIQWEICIISTYVHMYVHTYTYIHTVHFGQICLLQNYVTHPWVLGLTWHCQWTLQTQELVDHSPPWQWDCLQSSRGRQPAQRPLSGAHEGSLWIVAGSSSHSLHHSSCCQRPLGSSAAAPPPGHCIYAHTYSKGVKQSVMSQRLRVYTVEQIASFSWAKQNCW